MSLFVFLCLLEYASPLVVRSSDPRDPIVLYHTFSKFGPKFDYTYNITAPLVLSDPITVCGSSQGNYTDQIVLAQRYGKDKTCPYDLQVLTLQQQGAKAVIIMDTSNRSGMLWLSSSSHKTSDQIVIHSVYVSLESGLLLQQYLNSTSNVTVLISGEGEYIQSASETGHLIYLLTVVCVIALWVYSRYFFSDQTIIRRIMNKQKKLYNRISPVIYRKTQSGRFPSLWGPRTIDTNSAHFLEENRDSCPICLCDFEEGEVIKCLPCTHFFHKDCVDPWFLKEGSCPVCKQSLASTTSMYQHIGYINSELVKAIRLQRKINHFWRRVCIVVILCAFMIL